MSKFGDLITIPMPVLLEFFSPRDAASAAMQPILKAVASSLGNKVRVIKIDVDKNQELAKALQITGVPSFMIYKNGEMRWRQQGKQEATILDKMLRKNL